MLIIKKTGILVILTAFFLIHANAEISRFTISPIIGILYGQSEEIAYKYPEKDLYLSELLWDYKPLFYAGIIADYSKHDPFRQNSFTASSSFKYGFPFRAGILENRDWMNLSQNNITHYSRHDAYSSGAVFADISAGFSWSLRESLVLKTYGEFSYKRLSWSAKDGYLQYPSSGISGSFPAWDNNLPKQEVRGEVIRYTQNWFILAPRFYLKWKLIPSFSIMGNFNYSPLVYCYARDDHLLEPPRSYHDYLFFGHYFNGSAEFAYSPDNNLGFSLNLSYSHISGTRGDSQTGTTLNRKGAGAGYSAFGIGLAFTMRPFGYAQTGKD